MIVLGICGSPRKKNSTTLFALKEALKEVESIGSNIKTDLIELSKLSFSGCNGCNTKCIDSINCSIQDDFSALLIPKLTDPSIKGLILASPVYFGSVTSLMKAFIDRCVVFRRNNYHFQNKVGGAITVGKSRHGGQELAAMDLIKNFLIQGMIVVPDATPTSHFGGMLWSGKEGGIETDEMGIKTAKNLGYNMGKTILKLYN